MANPLVVREGILSDTLKEIRAVRKEFKKPVDSNRISLKSIFCTYALWLSCWLHFIRFHTKGVYISLLHFYNKDFNYTRRILIGYRIIIK